MYYGQASRYIIIIAGIFKVIESDAVIPWNNRVNGCIHDCVYHILVTLEAMAPWVHTYVYHKLFNLLVMGIIICETIKKCLLLGYIHILVYYIITLLVI